ncbi:hypothetical protein M2360_000944 [Rhizobium sp. SG_E_25_P2]|uniref:hypothetical protein n=1 Tax=Rhizobium sp. SG_E_25_P2 TaxID=2879942 RepID=UPI0024760E72|nr:hypothetical protein [Rhizobium sp. SG_E_25_P2]MDH6265554.1 hypothetical protein [Rhizobium sp. SG_E_25_P2]
MSALPQLGLGQLGLGHTLPPGGSPRGLSNWIFAASTWSDAGYWQDFRNWSATGLFINSEYWGGGSWSDAAVW